VKQLTLSSLNTLLVLSESKGITCQVDIELIVNSLKATTNPRTQRETLVLLCHIAHLVPVSSCLAKLCANMIYISQPISGQSDAPFGERFHLHGHVSFETR